MSRREEAIYGLSSGHWTGYDPRLQNGNLDSLRNVEQNYDLGTIGDRNTTALYIEEVIDISSIQHVDNNRDPIDDQPKIIYSHPSNLPYSAGTRAGTEYFGGSAGKHGVRKVDGSAVLRIEEKPPVENMENLENVSTFLAGDEEDRNLEGRTVALQVNPFTV